MKTPARTWSDGWWRSSKLDLPSAQPQGQQRGEDDNEQEQERGQRRALTEILHAGALVAEGGAIEDEAEHIGRAERRSVETHHHVRDFKPVERADEQQGEENGRAGCDQRPDDVPEKLPLV